MRMVRDGYFSFKDYFQSLCDTVDGGKDFYLLGSDFESYLEAQAAVDKAFAYPNKWTQMSILSTAGSGIFSSDRTIQDYAEKTWGIEPCRFPSDGLLTLTLALTLIHTPVATFYIFEWNVSERI
ncbi:unnamed protein product [Prunus armeniaca]